MKIYVHSLKKGSAAVYSAFIYVNDCHYIRIFNHSDNTTVNRGLILACIKAIEYLIDNGVNKETIAFISNSTYLVNGLNNLEKYTKYPTRENYDLWINLISKRPQFSCCGMYIKAETKPGFLSQVLLNISSLTKNYAEGLNNDTH